MSNGQAKTLCVPAAADRAAIFRWLIPIVLLAALVWSYAPVIHSLSSDWRNDDNYSVGGLIPLAVLYLLWSDRKRFANCPIVPSWWGLVPIGLAIAARAFGVMAMFESAERYSMVFMVGGALLLVGGKELSRRAFWLWLFLFLMVPLPGKVHNMISSPLQSLSTTGAVMTLELLGVTVLREGHIMVLNDSVRVGMAEACSGLRMLTAFVAVSAGAAYVVRRPRWQKAIVLASGIPIAIVCNLLRAVVTAFMFLFLSSETAERFFHDFAGLLMMPIAILLLALELWVLSLLVTSDDDQRQSAHV